ncbi:MAG: type IV pilus secretin PilQ [Desulfobacterales bacterium]|nr:type IV pilus secretin PilQ [Desulfobacterales bacterium]
MNNSIYKSLSTKALIAFFAFWMLVCLGCTTNLVSRQKKTDPEENNKAKLINEISTNEDSEYIDIRVKGNRYLNYTSVKQPSPVGVILYFPDTDLGNIKTFYETDNDTISSIKVSKLTGKEISSKIEILLKKDASYQVTREGAEIIISFKKALFKNAEPNKAVKENFEEKYEKELGQKLNSDVKIIVQPDSYADSFAKDVENKTHSYIEKNKCISTTNVPVNETKSENLSWVNRVDFSIEDAGKSKLIIGTTKPVTYNISKPVDGKLELKLFSTRIADYHKRPLIPTQFESVVDRINLLQKVGNENISIVEIDLREIVPYFVEQSGNCLLIHFEAASYPSKAETESKPVIRKKLLMSKVDAVSDSSQNITNKSMTQASSATVYTGEKIALDFYETDIKNVFRILMEVSGKNFAIDKNVDGKVTLTFDKPVPWDQVLDLILKMNQLGSVAEGNIIRIATLATLKSEEENRQAKLAAMQKAREQEKALEPLITEYIAVNYSNAKAEILPHLEKIKTKDRGTLSVDERTNQIIMTDVAAKISQAKEIVQKLDNVTPQVIIEARIVEARTDFSREIGSQWGLGVGVQSSDLLNVDGLTSDVTDSLDSRVGVGPERGFNNLGGTYGSNMAVNLPVSAAAGTIGFNFVRIAGTPLLLNAKLMAMESEGEAKLISAPKIVTLDNKKATMKQGLRYPYNKLDESGNTVTQFEDIDLVLEVTPHVTLDHRISMNINITKSDLGSIINSQQSFTTKEAQTELLVNDGDTVVIGGIIKTTNRNSETGIPGLSKIPIIGWLFKSKTKSDDKEELLIFITPRIVQLEQRNMKS